jgi:hypothetical protein
MADEAEAPAAVVDVEMSVLDALKEVSKELRKEEAHRSSGR